MAKNVVFIKYFKRGMTHFKAFDMDFSSVYILQKYLEERLKIYFPTKDPITFCAALAIRDIYSLLDEELCMQ